MLNDVNKFKIFCGNANPDLAREIAAYLGTTVGDAVINRFNNGEVQVMINESVRGKDVFIVQPTCGPIVNDNVMELLIMVDAFKRASANHITAVIPYYGYARQDRKARGREPITAKLMADLLEAAGVTRVVTMDLHAAQIQGFFNIPFDHMPGAPTMAEYIKEKNLEDVIVVSPDLGGVGRARKFADLFFQTLCQLFVPIVSQTLMSLHQPSGYQFYASGFPLLSNHIYVAPKCYLLTKT